LQKSLVSQKKLSRFEKISLDLKFLRLSEQFLLKINYSLTLSLKSRNTSKFVEWTMLNRGKF